MYRRMHIDGRKLVPRLIVKSYNYFNGFQPHRGCVLNHTNNRISCMTGPCSCSEKQASVSEQCDFCTPETCGNSGNCCQTQPAICPHGLKQDGDDQSQCSCQSPSGSNESLNPGLSIGIQIDLQPPSKEEGTDKCCSHAPAQTEQKAVCGHAGTNTDLQEKAEDVATSRCNFCKEEAVTTSKSNLSKEQAVGTTKCSICKEKQNGSPKCGSCRKEPAAKCAVCGEQAEAKTEESICPSIAGGKPCPNNNAFAVDSNETLCDPKCPAMMPCVCCFPPAYSQFGCTGNINGNCSCGKRK